MIGTIPMPSTPTNQSDLSRPLVSIRRLSKSYQGRSGDALVLHEVNIDVQRGEFLCIVGPSGAGKTTLLRCASGLLPPSAGEVLLDGERIDRPPARLALVFQDYSRSLMPWMSVERNVALPLRSKGMSKAERVERARSSLAAVGLSASRDQYPWQLSGGMQQRVAIARALAFQPDALLMDEPFASVDAQTRAGLEDLILGVRDQFDVTVIFVTHDIDEAVYLGDTVAILSGSPTTVRERITIDLGVHRSQLATKARPEFAALRTRVLQLIRDDPRSEGQS